MSADHTGFSLFNARASRKIQAEFIEQRERDRNYISDLEMFVMENGLTVPAEFKDRHEKKTAPAAVALLMEDGSLDSLAKTFERIKPHAMIYEVKVQYRNLTFWNDMPKKTIPTVGSAFKGLLMGSGKKERVNIIKDLTGRILPGRMTLVMGPPGCGEYIHSFYLFLLSHIIYLSSIFFLGKSTFLKALSGQLTIGSAHLDGDILYNGDSVSTGKYLVGKLATYSEEKEQHAGTLTVRETLEFAWKITTGGHHSYGIAKDAKSAEILDRDDEHQVKVE